MKRNIHPFQGNSWQEKTPKYLERSPKSKLYKILRYAYDRFLYPARNSYLGDYLSRFTDHGESILDIGCAEGTIPYLISQKKNVTDLNTSIMVNFISLQVTWVHKKF